MKRIVTAAAALLFSAATFAQDNQTPPPAQGNPNMHQRVQMTPDQRAKRETDRINSTTPLGDDVYQKVLKVNTDFEKQQAAIMGGAKRNELTNDQRTQLKTNRENKTKQLQAAMGKELFEKWKAAERAQREQKSGQPQGGAPNEEHN